VEVTGLTYLVAVFGLLLSGFLWAAQLVAVIRPRSRWTIENIYGGRPDRTDPRAYFAFNQSLAWADVFCWLPLQIAGCTGMILGQRWGFLLALIGSVPFWYTSILLYFWDRDLGFRQNTVAYWVLWVIFPAFGVLEGVYCFVRLMR